MLNFGLLGGAYVAPPFNGGMFVNGGFEDGIVGWQAYGSWTGVNDAAENPGTVANDLLFQNFTFELGVSYEISATLLEGDAVVNFMINDADSGIDITAGVHTFVGDGTARSTGIFVHTAGTTLLRVDDLKLNKGIK